MQGKGKAIAYASVVIVLLIIVACVYWNDVFPPKADVGTASFWWRTHYPRKIRRP